MRLPLRLANERNGGRTILERRVASFDKLEPQLKTAFALRYHWNFDQAELALIQRMISCD